MWNTFISALSDIADSGRTPPDQLSRAVMRLYEGMVRCRETYLLVEVQLAQPELDIETLRLKTTQDLLQNWHDAISQLILTLWQLQDILPIFVPEVASALATYVESEVPNYSQPRAVVDYNNLSDENREYFGRLVLTLKGAGESSGFNAAITDLRRFIREHFTMEQLYG